MLPSVPPSSLENRLGTVTFLFTDIEGSTLLYQKYPDVMQRAMTRHHAIMQTAIARHHGHVFQIIGDAFHSAFDNALDGVNAALEAQRALSQETWGEAGSLRVRMALHTDHAIVQQSKYEAGEYGAGEYLSLARTARLLSVGAGGQILLSAATAELVRERLPAHVGLRDLGRHRIKDFQPQQLFQLTAPDLPAEFPRLRTLESLPNNLPLQLTSFVGREKEIAELKRQLEQARLVTLTGPGGAGKTRLSLQIAAECADQFEHGVWLVELAPLAEPRLVPQVVATTLGLHEPPGRSMLDLLQEYVRNKQLLLVLDNCEHLIEACAQLADTLLRSAPQLKILATSREALGIAGEIARPVPPLSFPKAALSFEGANSQDALATLLQYEAVRLFVERARAVQPAFAVTVTNAAAVAEICERLDGIPLALELAAARVKAMTVEQIARRLDDRFRLLTGGGRTTMARHQTLQAAVEWSYALLAEPECVLLQRLSVFAGGWTLEAAEHVGAGNPIQASEVLDLLLRLVDKSLVVVDQQTTAARYRLLDTLRLFAHDKLVGTGEAHATRVRNQHLAYFLSFVEEIDQTLRGAEQESALAALDRELDNLRAALSWSAQSGDVQAELRLASGLWRYWRVRSYFSEGRHWLEDALARGGSAPPLARAKALLGAGSLANYQADYARAGALLEQSLALHRQLDDPRGIAYCLNLLSHSKMMLGDFVGAQAALEESLAIFRKLGDSRGIGYALYFLGSLYEATGDLAAARRVLEESLTHLQQADDTWWVGNAMIQLGWGLNRQGEYARAVELFDEALEISAQFGDARGRARALQYLAEAQCSQGDYEGARRQYREALELLREIGDKWWGTLALEGLAYVAAQQNEARRAARLLGAADRMHELLGAPILTVYRESQEWSRDRARAQLGERAFSEAWEEGRALSFDAAIQFALSDEPG